TARLAFGTPSNLSVSAASQIALAVFDGLPGQRVSLKIVPGSSSSMSLYRPDQTKPAGHATGILVTLMEPPLLPASGTYQFLLDPTGSGTGTTEVTLYDVPPDISGPIATDGTPLTVTTTVPGQNARHTFDASSSDRISLFFTSGPSGSVAIQKPDGSA